MIFEDSTMWKYRDLTELTQNKYSLEYVKKHDLPYLMVEKNIVIYGRDLMIVVYGFTIEDWIYCDLFHYQSKSICSIDDLTLKFPEAGSSQNQSDIYSSTFIGNNTKYIKSEREFSFEMWFISNFGPDLNNFNKELYLKYFIKKASVNEYDKVVKTYLPESYHNL